MKRLHLAGLVVLCLVSACLLVSVAHAHPPSANSLNCSGPGADCEGANARFKTLRVKSGKESYLGGPAFVDGGVTVNGTLYVDGGVFINGNLTVDGGTLFYSWDAGMAWSVPTNQPVCLNWPTCSATLKNTSAQTVDLSGALTLPAGSSISWGAAVGVLAVGTTHGLQLNTAGGSAGSAQPDVQAVLDRSVATTPNSGSGETTLYTYSIPASTLNANGRGVRLTSVGTLAANGNTKTLRAKFGGTTITSPNTSNSAFVSWKLVITCNRTGASAEVCTANYDIGGGTNSWFGGIATPAEATSGAIAFVVTAQGTSTSDIVHALSFTEFIP